MKIKIIKLNIIFISCVITSACVSAPISPENQREALFIHNQLRKKHDAPPLQWDSHLASFAASYAAYCQFKHSHQGYGENLAAGYPTVKAAILAWYAENKNYSYQQARYLPGIGHFTQLVWKSSTRLGCGIAACNGRHGTPGNMLVCEYSPAGNVVNAGYFKANVQRPMFPAQNY